jgi:hypothetical protein
MMKKYNILWIDDEHENWMEFKILAERASIKLTSFKSFDEGFDHLEKNLELIDGVLLDAMFFQSKNQTKGTEDLKGLAAAHRRLIQLESKKFLPRFILSGQTRLDIDNTFEQTYGKHYRKSNLHDIEKLFIDIKDQADQLPDAQIKQKYIKLFELCTERYLGVEQFSRLFTLIRHIENVEMLSDTEDMLNPIRKIIERIFRRMAENGIIPESLSTNASSRFLAQKQVEYEYLFEIVPPIISEGFHRLVNITQDGSHGEGELKLKVDQYLKSAQSDYLYRSCVFLLFDLLLWFKEFMDNNSNKDTNKARWKSKVSNGVWIAGTVTRIADNGWGTFQPDKAHATISIPPKMVTDNHLNETDSIKIIAEPSPDRTKTFIKAISREA